MMTQRALPVLAFGLFAAFLLMVFGEGCGPGNTPNSAGSSLPPADTATTDAASEGTSIASDSPHADPPPLFEGWPTPKLVLVLSGEQKGYLEPCGCSENQSGGLSRRADLFRQIGERNWPITAFDLGGSVKRSRRQSVIKFEVLCAALKDMNYATLALGPEEIRLDPDFLIAQVPDPTSPDVVPFSCANVTFTDFVGFGSPLRWKLVEQNGVKIAVTAILGPSLKNTITVSGSNLDAKFSVEDPATALAEVVPLMKESSPDIMLLLSHASLEESEALAKQFPDFQLVLSAGAPEDPDGEPKHIGKSLLLTVGQKSKHIGVVGFFPEDSETRFRFELVELDRFRFKDTPQMVEHMRLYQDRLRDEQVAATEPPITYPSGATYVGVETCGECHTKAYEKWEKTPHAKAFESLKHPREGQPDYGITRIYDAECIACHVTGWEPQEVLRYRSGFVNEEFAQNDLDRERSPLLRGVQCENCHGPGSRHIELINAEQMEAAKKEVRVTLEQAQRKVCYTCHDLDNSPDFDFETYWPQIEHPGLD